MEPMSPGSPTRNNPLATGNGTWLLLGLAWLSLSLLAGCASHRGTPEERYEAARALFDQTTKQFHLPSAEASGAEQERLRNQAAAGYRELLRRYPDQEFWAVQALRSQGNIRAAQGRLDEAVRLYAAVGRKYPRQDWEVMMAWKSAADLLWDAGRQAEAAGFYRQIVERFDSAEAPAIVQTVVRGSQRRLAHLADPHPGSD